LFFLEELAERDLKSKITTEITKIQKGRPEMALPFLFLF